MRFVLNWLMAGTGDESGDHASNNAPPCFTLADKSNPGDAGKFIPPCTSATSPNNDAAMLAIGKSSMCPPPLLPKAYWRCRNTS